RHQAKRNVRPRHQCRYRAVPGSAVACGELLKMIVILPMVSRDESGSAVGQQPGRGILGVEILDAARGEIRLQQLVTLAGDEQGMPRRVEVVDESGLGYLAAAYVATQPGIALKHSHAPSCLGQDRGAYKARNAAADEDCVIGRGHWGSSQFLFNVRF